MNTRTILLAVVTALLLSDSGLAQRPYSKEIVDLATRKARLGDIKEDRGYDEIRVWHLSDDESVCLVVRKHNSKYQAIRLDIRGGKRVRISKADNATFSSFERLWKQLNKMGAFAIPDSKDLKGGARVLDGFDVLVQYRNGSAVGSYAYENPFYQPWPEAREVIEVAMLVARAFEAEGIEKK